jgi:hypothetical protein
MRTRLLSLFTVVTLSVLPNLRAQSQSIPAQIAAPQSQITTLHGQASARIAPERARTLRERFWVYDIEDDLIQDRQYLKAAKDELDRLADKES